MVDSEDITRQRELLEVHRRTLHHYLRQQAAFGNIYTPPAVSSGISEARAQIKRIKASLRAQGAVVHDQPQDDDAIVDDAPLRVSARSTQKYRGIMLVIIGAAIVLLLVWRIVIPQIQPSPSSIQVNGSGVMSTSGTANSGSIASAPRQRTVALPEGDTVTIPYRGGKVTYTITRAEIQPQSPGRSLLSLTIRMSTTLSFGANLSNDYFGLRLNDETLRSIGFMNEVVYPNETQEGVLEFSIPSETAQAHVTFTIGESPTELLIEVK